MADLQALKDHIELFLLQHPQCILHDSRAGWLRVADWRFNLEIQFQKLIWTLWNSERTIARRILHAEIEGENRLAIRAMSGLNSPVTMEIDGRVLSENSIAKKAARDEFRRHMIQLLQKDSPELRVDHLLCTKDLSRSFSERYIRGLGRERKRAWVLFGVSALEDQATVDSALSFALIWWNHACTRPVAGAVAGVKLFAPEGRCGTLATRVGNLSTDRPRIDLIEYDENFEIVRKKDPADFGNLVTKLSRVDRVPLPREETPIEYLPAAIRSKLNEFQVVHRPASGIFSIRFHGLEFARLTEDREPKLSFGVGSMDTAFAPEREKELAQLIHSLQRIRRANSRSFDHPYYCLQSERWLEAMLLEDIRQIRADLDPQFVYPQVPAFSGVDRGVIDILTVTQSRQLAVIELKVAEDINLPLQALDYWTRVKWHHERGDFKQQGYFSGIEIAPRPPLLFLVCPAFRFHSTTEEILKFFPRQMEIIKVGLNEAWRAGVQILYRRRV